jgi:hypothetical protein
VYLILRNHENTVMLSGSAVLGYRFLHIRPQHVSKIANFLVTSVAFCMLLNLTKTGFFPFAYQLQNPNAAVLTILGRAVRSLGTLPRITHYHHTNSGFQKELQ